MKSIHEDKWPLRSTQLAPRTPAWKSAPNLDMIRRPGPLHSYCLGPKSPGYERAHSAGPCRFEVNLLSFHVLYTTLQEHAVLQFQLGVTQSARHAETMTSTSLKANRQVSSSSTSKQSERK